MSGDHCTITIVKNFNIVHSQLQKIGRNIQRVQFVVGYFFFKLLMSINNYIYLCHILYLLNIIQINIIHTIIKII